MYLLDTHVLLRAGQDSPRLSARSRALLADPTTDVLFSVVSVWEIVIKASLGRREFRVDAERVRDGALRAGMTELPVRGPHALAVRDLRKRHGDPFDRMLLAQARYEGMTLLTVDDAVLAYGAPAVRA